MLSNFERVLDRLEVASRNADKAKAFCPALDDRNNPSLSVGVTEDGKVLLKCFVGCPTENVVSAMGLEMSDLFEHRNDQRGGEAFISLKSAATVEHSRDQKAHTINLSEVTRIPDEGEMGCTLKDYAEAKGLAIEFLRGVSLKDVTYMDLPAVRIPYPDEHGQEVAVRFRVSLDGTEKFKWRRGDKPRLYGLALLEEARKAGYVILVEGESDCHTLWHHDFPALGVPGASNWRNEWAEKLDGIEKVYAVVEPDRGGEAFWERLAASPIRERLYRVELEVPSD